MMMMMMMMMMVMMKVESNEIEKSQKNHEKQQHWDEDLEYMKEDDDGKVKFEDVKMMETLEH